MFNTRPEGSCYALLKTNLPLYEPSERSSLIDFKTYVEIVEISFFSLLLLIFAFCVSSGTRLISSLCITLIVSLNPYLINLLFTNSESIISINFSFCSSSSERSGVMALALEGLC